MSIENRDPVHIAIEERALKLFVRSIKVAYGRHLSATGKPLSGEAILANILFDFYITHALVFYILRDEGGEETTIYSLNPSTPKDRQGAVNEVAEQLRRGGVLYCAVTPAGVIEWEEYNE
jgi:hypothetical protein